MKKDDDMPALSLLDDQEEETISIESLYRAIERIPSDKPDPSAEMEHFVHFFTDPKALVTMLEKPADQLWGVLRRVNNIIALCNKNWGKAASWRTLLKQTLGLISTIIFELAHRKGDEWTLLKIEKRLRAENLFIYMSTYTNKQLSNMLKQGIISGLKLPGGVAGKGEEEMPLYGLQIHVGSHDYCRSLITRTYGTMEANAKRLARTSFLDFQ